ncbi:WD repeat-containing protein 43 [Galleria mellonella]|uniref:WD repeat-containing protein 43 n=1 Tax=Galleria mellonella TaxID=7137 RepID=A0ABM3M9Z3_GALME|nr:WD repeat-containing protein 43 [Galleria mellonella]
MAVAAFSEDGKYYSYISKDGRLRIWETETNILKQEYTPDLHLRSPPVCLQWITLAVSNSSQKGKGGKRNSISHDESQSIALGTKNGKILIYSLAQAKVETVLSLKQGNAYNSSINALDWQRKSGLYSCNKSSYLYQWDLSKGNVKFKYNVTVDNKNKQANNISAIKIIPHNQDTSADYIITASWQVCLWRLHNEDATILRHLGHNTTAKALLSVTTSNGSSWLIEGSQNERLLSFWDVTITEEHVPQVNGEVSSPKKKQRKTSVSISSTPMYSFILEDAPSFIDASMRSEDEGSSLQIAAATRSGVVHYYRHTLNGSSVKPIKPSVTIQVTSSGATPFPLQCCHLRSQDVLVGYTSGPVTLFENVTPDLKSKTQILIRAEQSEQTSKVDKRKNETNEVNKVRTGDTKDVTYVEPMGGVSRKRPVPGGKIEIPMEARLENLALDPKSRSKSAVSQNLTKLLMQGLHSKDKNLILTVLLKDDPAVASQTVAHLPPEYVPLLLEQLTIMANKKTTQCAAACTWAAAALRAHAALLLAARRAPAHAHLAQLLAYLTHRRSHLCQLLNLKGRLELAMAQRSAKNDHIEGQEAILDYNDDSSSGEEMEVEKYHSESEHTWDDDKLPGESDDEKSADRRSEHSEQSGNEMDTDSGQSDED